ncbi:head decoration protein [Pseudomonas sp. LRF_L74]|uniref:head decoration protein n=1 Tax=Pseudomonas sp. LRF_L74 TaxID=3369422 RepID=UPI003F5EE5AD
MTRIKTEGVHAGEFLLSEANGGRSREAITVSAGSGRLVAGTVLALITAANALTAAATAGNTGNGTIGSTAVTSLAASGTYTLTITEAAANGGEFKVVGADGFVLGTGTVGEAFSQSGITFTVADGTTDFALGDSFTLTVKGALGEYTAYDDDGTDDGRRTASAILFAGVDATYQDVRATVVVRDAEVIERLLTGLDTAGAADLKALGIIIRP